MRKPILGRSSAIVVRCSSRLRRRFASVSADAKLNDEIASPSQTLSNGSRKRDVLPPGKGLRYFMRQSNGKLARGVAESVTLPPYLSQLDVDGAGRNVYYETYGCQMNVSDTDVVRSILQTASYGETTRLDNADVILLMTCAIREGAESKVFGRLQALRKAAAKRHATIGILGCMAERLKERLLERDGGVDVVAGPDAYRDLPRLLAAASQSVAASMNVQLSLDETYADVRPVRANPGDPTAFVSVMRGCENMCTYCIVPFTRGRERSRPLDSIVDEVRALSAQVRRSFGGASSGARLQGVKQVTLLGQNVNSYRDVSESVHLGAAPTAGGGETARGFRTVYRARVGGRRFVELLDQVSRVDADMRVRFVSPHPKDFPDEVLQLIAERRNICNQIHLPAQSGNDDVLAAMGRGYSRQSYLDLVERIREIIPDVCLTSDFIAGFCGESAEAHADSLSLMERVRYSKCYCFPYSMREVWCVWLERGEHGGAQKTRAFRRLVDDVSTEEKKRRTGELLDVHHRVALELHRAFVGTRQLVLVDSSSKRSHQVLAGRNDQGVKVLVNLPLAADSGSELPKYSLADLIGRYVEVEVFDASSMVLHSNFLRLSSLVDYLPPSDIV